MANTGYSQQALAADPQFRNRVKSALSAVAWQVNGEADTTPNHVNRLAYAKQVLRMLDGELNVILPTFVMRPNVLNFETQYDWQSGMIVSKTTDADITSQLTSDWDAMAAAAGFYTPTTPV